MGQEIEVKPPVHVVADWNYFLKYVDGKRFPISSYFDKENWKINTKYRIRISHIYDPSHFWVVSKENEVDVLHKYLHHFYSKYKSHYKVPYKNFKINMYCVVYTEGAFYRAILANIPRATKSESCASAFLIDFGFMAKVSIDEVYFMTTKMYTIPQFAIRATLSGMGPIDSATWSVDVVSNFNKLVCNRLLFCEVTSKNHAEKILYLKLGEFNWNSRRIDSLNDLLITGRLAKQLSLVEIREMKHVEKKNKNKRGKKIKLPFLVPTFDEIEKVACLDSVLSNRFLESFIC